VHNGQPIDSATHIACVRLTWTLVSRIQSVLRPEEINACAQQFTSTSVSTSTRTRKSPTLTGTWTADPVFRRG
jgi:hypothetical protein